MPDEVLGFYWIRALPKTDAARKLTTDWQVADKTQTGWYVCGDTLCYKDTLTNRKQLEIGQYLKPPAP
jgi:hypothetical protein